MRSAADQELSATRRRRWHAKVTSGCMTCRKRRVKCDEKKPVCKVCSRLQLVCQGDGYGPEAAAENNKSPRREFHVLTPEAYESSSSSGNSVVPDSSLDLIRPSSPSSSVSSRASSRLPPISSLLGAGRYDPFNSSYVSNASQADRRILDHALHYQWAIIATSEKQQDLNAVKSDIMSYVLTDPVAWYTIIYAGAVHHAYWTQAPTEAPRPDPTLLYMKNRATRAMIPTLTNRKSEMTDEMLLSMALLAGLGSGESIRREKRSKVQSRKTLVRAMDAEYYGALDPSAESLRAAYKLIERRGGIQTIRSRAVRVALILFDVWNSWKTLCCPGLPRAQALSEVLQSRTWFLDSKGDRLYDSLTLHLIPVIEAAALPECATLLQIIECLRVLTTDLDQIQRTPKPESVLSAPNQSILIWLRSMVMHTLLSLPDYGPQALESDDIGNPGYIIFELCRISCFMYAQTWLYAIVNSKLNMARKLLSKMHPLLLAATSERSSGGKLSDRYPTFFLWAVVLSLMCAYEDFDVTGDPTSMQQISPFLTSTQAELCPESWSKIPDKLETLLWSRSECELNGREAWQQACILLSPAISVPEG